MSRIPRDWFKTETDYVKFLKLKKDKQSINIKDITKTSHEYDPWYNPCTFVDEIDTSKLNGSKFGKIVIDDTSGSTNYPNISLQPLVTAEFNKGNTTFYCSYQDFDIQRPRGLFEMNAKNFGTLICDFKFPENANITRLFTHTKCGQKIVANFNDIPVSNSTSYIFNGSPKEVELINFPGCYEANWLSGVTNGTKIAIRGLRLSTTLSKTTWLTREQLVQIITDAKVVTNQTLVLGADNITKLTEEDIALANSKGWTIA